jgi:hypothetical protein
LPPDLAGLAARKRPCGVGEVEPLNGRPNCEFTGEHEAGRRNKFVRFLIMRIINVIPLMMGWSTSVAPEGKP